MLLPETGVGGVFDPIKSNLSLARPSCLAAAKTSDSRGQDINKYGLLMEVGSSPKSPPLNILHNSTVRFMHLGD